LGRGVLLRSAVRDVDREVAAVPVSYEVVDRVARITLDRPTKRNAMDLGVFDGLTELAARARDDERVGAVLVSGCDGVFSAGIDGGVLGGQLVAGDGADAVLIGRLQAAFTAYEELDVPTIAAIEGYCFGAGLQLAAACHLRAATPTAQLSVMEAEWGLVPDLGGTWRLPRLIGLGRATELALTARRVDGDEAARIGLVEVVLPVDEPQAAAHELAARLASGPGASRRVPRLLRENLARPRDEALAEEAAVQLEVLAGPDVREAAQAKLEGRAPRFAGR
jgi:enoyl-CoA hydratase/carnithine racemase